MNEGRLAANGRSQADSWAWRVAASLAGVLIVLVLFPGCAASLEPLAWPLSLVLLFVLPVVYAVRAARRVYLSRDHPDWHRMGRWLPLRGRWLCYVAMVLSVPIAAIVAFAGIAAVSAVLYELMIRLFS